MFIKTLALCFAIGGASVWSYNQVKVAMRPTLKAPPVLVWSGTKAKAHASARGKRPQGSNGPHSQGQKAMARDQRAVRHDQDTLRTLILNRTAQYSARNH